MLNHFISMAVQSWRCSCLEAHTVLKGHAGALADMHVIKASSGTRCEWLNWLVHTAHWGSTAVY